MAEQDFIFRHFAYLGKACLNELLEHSPIRTFPAGTELVREGQYIKVVPLVLSGLVKVMTQFEDKELLLYFIQPEQSCIMSFSACIHHSTSRIVAITEEESEILLLPADKLNNWISTYPVLNKLFYQQYDLRYEELIQTVNHLLYYKLDKRLLEYLAERKAVLGGHIIKITHKEIAKDLGTAREVVSRIIKKLEKQQVLKQYADGIEIL